jgi:hypothetical protein
MPQPTGVGWVLRGLNFADLHGFSRGRASCWTVEQKRQRELAWQLPRVILYTLRLVWRAMFPFEIVEAML